MHTALIGKEQHMVVGGGHIDTLDEVLFLQILCVHTSAATGLGTIGIHRHTLHIALIGNGESAGLFLNEIFDIDLVLDLLDLSLALIAKLIPDGDDFLPEHTLELLGICKQLIVVSDLFLQLVELGLEFFSVQTLQGLQAHIQDSLGLDLVQAKPLAQTLLGIVIGRADDADDLVDIILGDEQTL